MSLESYVECDVVQQTVDLCPVGGLTGVRTALEPFAGMERTKFESSILELIPAPRRRLERTSGWTTRAKPCLDASWLSTPIPMDPSTTSSATASPSKPKPSATSSRITGGPSPFTSSFSGAFASPASKAAAAPGSRGPSESSPLLPGPGGAGSGSEEDPEEVKRRQSRYRRMSTAGVLLLLVAGLGVSFFWSASLPSSMTRRLKLNLSP